MSWLPEKGDDVHPSCSSPASLSSFISNHNPTSPPSTLTVPQISHTFPHWSDFACAVTSVGKIFPVVLMSYCLLHPIPLLRETSFCWGGGYGHELNMIHPQISWPQLIRPGLSTWLKGSQSTGLSTTYHLWLMAWFQKISWNDQALSWESEVRQEQICSIYLARSKTDPLLQMNTTLHTPYNSLWRRKMMSCIVSTGSSSMSGPL